MINGPLYHAGGEKSSNLILKIELGETVMLGWRNWAIKKLIVKFIVDHSESFINHSSWSTRLKARNYNFDLVYNDYSPEEISNANVGAGPYFRRKHWVAVDFLPDFKSGHNKALLHHDLSLDPDNLPISQFRNIYTSHTLEHFEISVSARLLKATNKSVRPGGRVRAVVPDAGYILDNYREGIQGGLEYFESVFGPYAPSPEDYVFHTLAQSHCKILSKKPNPKYDSSVYDEFKARIQESNNDEICMWLNSLPSFQDDTGSLHRSCYTSTIFMDMFKTAGFTDVYQSGFMKSKSPEMREVPLFDGTHPWLSLYVEGKK